MSYCSEELFIFATIFVASVAFFFHLWCLPRTSIYAPKHDTRMSGHGQLLKGGIIEET